MKREITLATGKTIEFSWGLIDQVHTIGDISIVEYTVKGSGTAYHPYVGDSDTQHNYTTLDRAIIGALAWKHDGHNTRADYYFFKMVGME